MLVFACAIVGPEHLAALRVLGRFPTVSVAIVWSASEGRGVRAALNAGARGFVCSPCSRKRSPRRCAVATGQLVVP